MARPTIMPAPVAKPCSARIASSCSMLCTIAQAMDDSRYSTTPPRITRRRP